MASSQVRVFFQNGATAGTQLYTNKTNEVGLLHKCRLIGAAANATAQVYDNTSATGNPVATLSAPSTWPDETDHNGGIQILKGLYVVVTGTGASLHITME